MIPTALVNTCNTTHNCVCVCVCVYQEWEEELQHDQAGRSGHKAGRGGWAQGESGRAMAPNRQGH